MTISSGVLLVSSDHNKSDAAVIQDKPFYGWVIVTACTLILFMQAGILYSFGVFFKPLVDDFGWSRAATSGVHSLFMISFGVFAIPMGWLADRFGAAKIAALCGFVTGLGLVLTSQINALWQMYLVYGLIIGIGLSGTFPIATATTTRWFVKRRGLALGIVSAGIGLGTLVMLPIARHVIVLFGWSTAYFILGVTAWLVMLGSAFFLRRSPEKGELHTYGAKAPLPKSSADHIERANHIAAETAVTLRNATRTRSLWMLMLIYLLFNFCVQMIMIHLVNYTTDLGIAPLVSATLVSVVGMTSTAGRMVMGTASDRIGSNNSLIICCTILAMSLLWLIFARELWMFYLFAIVFGFSYGGEVPQIPTLISQFFGLRAVTALVGAVILSTTIGGALGSWMAGQIFDLTQSYHTAFIIAVVTSLSAAVMALMLKRVKIS